MTLSLVKKSSKGAPLSADDFDGNMTAIENAVNSLDSVAFDDRVTQNETDIADHETRITSNEGTLVTHDGRLDSLETDVTNHTTNTSGNPHNVTKAQVGLTNVSNDAQLKRSEGDFNSFSEKLTPVGDDVVLLEDSEDATPYTKKVASVASLMSLLALQSRSTDPPDPTDGKSVMWISDGTGSGSAGDMLVKINIGGTIKTFLLVQFNSEVNYES